MPVVHYELTKVALFNQVGSWNCCCLNMALFWQNRHRIGGHCRHCAADRECYATQTSARRAARDQFERAVSGDEDGDAAAALMDGHQQKKNCGISAKKA